MSPRKLKAVRTDSHCSTHAARTAPDDESVQLGLRVATQPKRLPLVLDAASSALYH